MTSPIENVEDFKTPMINNSQLCRAIKAKDVETVDRLLEQPDFDLTKEGVLALYHAISCNVPDIAHKLIQKGVDPNVNRYNWTLLHEAAFSNYVECVCMLLNCGIDLQISRNSEKTPLVLAFRNKNENIMKALLDHYYEFDGINLTNINFNIRKYFCFDNEDYILLCIALHNGYVEPFKTVWSRIDIELLAKFPPSQYFLTKYLYKSTFTPTEWLDSLYLILGSSEYVNLSTLHEHSFCYAYCSVEWQKYRCGLDVFYMSLGVEIDFEFFEVIWEHLVEKEKKIDALIYSGNNDLDPPKDDLFLLLYILLSCKFDITTSEVYGFLFTDLKNRYGPTIPVPWFKYFSLPRYKEAGFIKSTHWKCARKIDPSLQVSEFPSLLELARLQALNYIRQTRTIKSTHQFYDVVNELCLPTHLKDILLFKKPIYK